VPGTLSILCVLIGVVLVGLSLLNLPVADAVRPFVLGAGVAVLLVGAVPAATRTRRRTPRMPASDGSARVASAERDVRIAEPSPPVAPPRAQVALRVAGNGAAEPWVRWYQVEAATLNGVPAKRARVSVAVRGELGGSEEWRWHEGHRAVDLTSSPTSVPIVIGAVAESREPIRNGWVVPFRNWYLTPSNAALGRFLAPFISGFRHVFDVTVRWNEAGSEQIVTGSFELRFWRDASSPPRFMLAGERPTYQDQVGGLRELHVRGTALRKEGMMLPAAALNEWLGRVESWAAEARGVIAEVSTADSEYFWNASVANAPLFEGVRLHDQRHRQALRLLHERLNRLQMFVRG
jgi:hypothetical protein